MFYNIQLSKTILDIAILVTITLVFFLIRNQNQQNSSSPLLNHRKCKPLFYD